MSPVSYDHSILFTGHMIDAPEREAVRFPATAESAALFAIGNAVSLLQKSLAKAETTIGIAGGASGGDLLFHETCAQQNIPTLLRLALPIEQYMEASVAPSGPDWVRRFETLVTRIGPGAVRVLDETVNLPASLTGGAELNIWQRANLWMVLEAIAFAPQRTLIALWDGKPGDGPGGTEQLVEAVPGFGIEVAPIIRTQALLKVRES